MRGKNGQFMPGPDGDLITRLTARIQVMPNGCWEWTGSRNQLGYGIAPPGRHGAFRERAHRTIYQLVVGPIPDGLVLDHLCMNPPCVNPAHLEAVTQGENIRRAWAARATYLATGCKRGHPWNDENTYRRANGWRICRVCHRENERKNARRRRAKARLTGAAAT